LPLRNGTHPAGARPGGRGRPGTESMGKRMGCEKSARRARTATQGIGLALAVVATAMGACAQGRAPLISARLLLGTDAVHPGSKVKVAVVAEIPSGLHINEHKPTLEYLIPTEVKITSAEPLTVERVFYPPGQARKFTFEDKPLSVYEGTVVVGALLNVSSAAAAGDYTLHGEFSYQACNDQACFPPASVPVTALVKVVGKTVPLKPVNQDVFRRTSFK